MEIISYRLYTGPLLGLLLLSHVVSGELYYNFYDSSCPNLTAIVRNGIASALANDTRMAASLLRLHFHDCIVNGCDASILLDETSEFKGEKNAFPNRNSARGFEVIDAIKADVEKVCPSTVSCTDILTLAVREAIYMVGGPYWRLPMGRRDGFTANETAANEQIPSPVESLEAIIAKFTSKGLNLRDVVTLSGGDTRFETFFYIFPTGGHTIGFAQCFTFKSRLFDFNSTGNPDPSLDSSLLQSLQQICPNQADSNTNLAPLDPVTTNTFDNVYYRNLLNNSGLLQSDQALMKDNRTAVMVKLFNRFPILFGSSFGASMVKMSYIGVRSGDDGEIRKNCRVVN